MSAERSEWRFNRFTDDVGVSIVEPISDAFSVKNLLVMSSNRHFLIAIGPKVIKYASLDQLHVLFPKNHENPITGVDLKCISIDIQPIDIILSSDNELLLIIDNHHKFYVMDVSKLLAGEFTEKLSWKYSGKLPVDHIQAISRPYTGNQWTILGTDGNIYGIIDQSETIFTISDDKQRSIDGLSWHPSGRFMMIFEKNSGKFRFIDWNGTSIGELDADESITAVKFIHWDSFDTFSCVNVDETETIDIISCKLSSEKPTWTIRDEQPIISMDLEEKRTSSWYSLSLTKGLPGPMALIASSQMTEIQLVLPEMEQFWFSEDFYQGSLPITLENPEDSGFVGMAIDLTDVRGVDDQGKLDEDSNRQPIVWSLDDQGKLHGFHLYCSDADENAVAEELKYEEEKQEKSKFNTEKAFEDFNYSLATKVGKIEFFSERKSLDLSAFKKQNDSDWLKPLTSEEIKEEKSRLEKVNVCESDKKDMKTGLESKSGVESGDGSSDGHKDSNEKQEEARKTEENVSKSIDDLSVDGAGEDIGDQEKKNEKDVEDLEKDQIKDEGRDESKENEEEKLEQQQKDEQQTKIEQREESDAIEEKKQNEDNDKREYTDNIIKENTSSPIEDENNEENETKAINPNELSNKIETSGIKTISNESQKLFSEPIRDSTTPKVISNPFLPPSNAPLFGSKVAKPLDESSNTANAPTTPKEAEKTKPFSSFLPPTSAPVFGSKVDRPLEEEDEDEDEDEDEEDWSDESDEEDDLNEQDDQEIEESIEESDEESDESDEESDENESDENNENYDRRKGEKQGNNGLIADHKQKEKQQWGKHTEIPRKGHSINSSSLADSPFGAPFGSQSSSLFNSQQNAFSSQPKAFNFEPNFFNSQQTSFNPPSNENLNQQNTTKPAENQKKSENSSKQVRFESNSSKSAIEEEKNAQDTSGISDGASENVSDDVDTGDNSEADVHGSDSDDIDFQDPLAFEDYLWQLPTENDTENSENIINESLAFIRNLPEFEVEEPGFDGMLIQTSDETETLFINFQKINQQIQEELRIEALSSKDLDIINHWRIGNSIDISTVTNELNTKIQALHDHQDSIMKNTNETKKLLSKLSVSLEYIKTMVGDMSHDVETDIHEKRDLPLQAVELKRKVDEGNILVNEKIDEVEKQLNILKFELSKRNPLTKLTNKGIKDGVNKVTVYGKQVIKKANGLIGEFQQMRKKYSSNESYDLSESYGAYSVDESVGNLRENVEEKLIFLTRKSRMNMRRKLGEALRGAKTEDILE